MDENNVIDVSELFKTFQSDKEKQDFLEGQFSAMLGLQKKVKQLEEENKHLKELLLANAPSLNLPIPIIISPEEYLLDAQITILENRGRQLGHELTLEEVKKLDLLLKNKKMIKDGRDNAIKAESKPINSGKLSKLQLAKLAASNKDEVQSE